MRVQDGKSTDHWGVGNLYSLMQQLGGAISSQPEEANPERVATSDLDRMIDDWAMAWSSTDADDPERVLALFADDCVFEDVTFGVVAHGREELRSFVKQAFAAGTGTAEDWYRPGVADMPPTIPAGKEIMVSTGSAPRRVVLVHGGFVDGSGWRAVYNILTKDGYNVSVVQNPTLSLEGDTAATRRVIDAQEGPVILVGHSYGGGGVPPAGHPPHPGGPRLHAGVVAGQREGEHPPRP